MNGYSGDEQNCYQHGNGCSCSERKFYERFSYSGKLELIPKYLTCLTYSDHYRWVVHDYRIDKAPHIVGSSNTKPIEMIRGYYANYYHVLGTSLVMSIENPEMTFMNAPVSCMNGNCAAQ